MLTPRRLQYWFNRINREVFDGALPQVKLTYGRSRYRRVWGLFYGNDQPWRIHIDQRVRTRDELVATMAHEMIHLAQAANDLPLDHGAAFQDWAARCSKAYGLEV